MIDEAEYFQGAKNRLTMNQTYTFEFQCKYELQRYPFDAQVREERKKLYLSTKVREGIPKII